MHLKPRVWSIGVGLLHLASSMTSSETNSLEHGVTFDEAVECFFSDFQIRRE